MKTLIDLSPTHRGGAPIRDTHETVRAFETACEFLDDRGARPFTRKDIFRSCYSASATRHLIRAYLALGFIERLSDLGARPVYFRIAAHALPTPERAA